jgi:hypothetical protein
MLYFVSGEMVDHCPRLYFDVKRKEFECLFSQNIKQVFDYIQANPSDIPVNRNN